MTDLFFSLRHQLTEKLSIFIVFQLNGEDESEEC